MDDTFNVRRIDLANLSAADRLALHQHGDGEASAERRFQETIASVREGGDDALARLVMEACDADLDPSELQIGDGDFVHAFARLDPERTRALEESIDRLRDFHEAEVPQELWLKQVRPGQWAGHRYRPNDAVAFFVPSGRDARSEAAVMNTVPALVAGVPRVVIVTPPEGDGGVSDLILVAAATVGVGEIYKLDARSAMAALALGTERVPKVERLMGPSGSLPKSASRIVADDLEICMVGGNARTVVLADAWAHPDAIKRQLITVADAAGSGPALLISPSADLLDAVVERWPDGRACDFVLAPSMTTALGFVNETDPVHLSVFMVDPMSVLSSIDIAGEIELKGSRTGSLISPVDVDTDDLLDDPVCRSPLSVFDFLRRMPINYRTTAIMPDTVELQTRGTIAADPSSRHLRPGLEKDVS